MAPWLWSCRIGWTEEEVQDLDINTMKICGGVSDGSAFLVHHPVLSATSRPLDASWRLSLHTRQRSPYSQSWGDLYVVPQWFRVMSARSREGTDWRGSSAHLGLVGWEGGWDSAQGEIKKAYEVIVSL